MFLRNGIERLPPFSPKAHIFLEFCYRRHGGQDIATFSGLNHQVLPKWLVCAMVRVKILL